jgi:DNA-binding MarR family transcriptional regulator
MLYGKVGSESAENHTPCRIFAKSGEAGIARAYPEQGNRPQEIAAHLGVHYATVSRKIKKLERRTS